MSLFSRNNSSIKDCVTFFNSLNREKQAIIVADLNKVFSDEVLRPKLKALLSAIRTDLAKHDLTVIENKLYELGMATEFAKLIVGSMIKQMPTIGYDLKVLSGIEDTRFKELIPKLMVDVWIKKKNKKTIMVEQGISESVLQAFMNSTRSFMNKLVVKELDDKKLISILTLHKITQSQADVFINTLKIHTKFWFDMVMFSNSQSSFRAIQELKQQNDVIQELKQQNDAILKILKVILEKMQDNRSTYNSNPYQ